MKLPEQIETGRLVLRAPRMDDAPVIFAGWTRDKEMTRYLTWRLHQRVQETEAFIQNCLSAWEAEIRFPYIITLKESGEVIGMIDPRIEGPKVGIGYGVAHAHWGKGYVTEATRAIIDWAFQQPSILRVYAATDKVTPTQPPRRRQGWRGWLLTIHN